jgi:Asp-tRNA(Asn)/Glu-tRNA(Gln) amidotransferase C subunit
LQLEHLARLSLLRLPSNPADAEKLRSDLHSILAFARRVQSDASSVASQELSKPAQWQGGVPLSLASSARLPRADELPDECSTMHLLRDDEVCQVMQRDQLLANCPEHEHGYISVPKSIDR